MSLTRYYRRIVVLPSLLLIGGIILFTIYDLNFGSGKNYKSEWLTADAVDEYVIAMVIAHCAIVCVLCLSVFFIRRPRVRANNTLIFFSWFLLPILYLGFLSYQMGRSFYYHGDESGTLLAFGVLILPFMISLIVTFIQFRCSLKAPSPPTAE